MTALAKFVLPVLLVASCSTQWSARASENHECIIVDEVEIVTSSPSGLNGSELNLWAANSGHQLRPGSSSVLSLRIFSEKEGIADSQYFMKVTGYLHGADALGTKKLRLENGHFSSGWSGFAYKADFWVSDKIAIDIRPLLGSENVVEVTGLIGAANSYRRDNKEFDLHFTCKLTRRVLTELSPWQGGAGDIWNSFYP